MLAPGATFGRYTVSETIGSGGMGEVFRAHDAELARDVAIKVLPERFRMDSRRLARFEREARVLASLNHPNIATLHSVEWLGEHQMLVLELVEGETLSERIARGPIRVPEALAIAKQVAAALEAAHEQNVIHRDLKPSNIKLRSDGTVKLLDFGLAKICEPMTDAASPAVTLTMEVAGGGIMGTPAYMSPEHARGLPVDKRTDIWAFGCVLYEMLTGTAVFKGERASDVVAKVIEREPDFTALPRELSPTVKQLLQRCLRKDPRERLRDIGDARIALEESVVPEDARERRRFGWAGVTAIVAIAVVGAIATIDVALRLSNGTAPSPAAPSVTRFAIAATIVPSAYARSLAISPDGARFAYISDRGLIVRQRDRIETTELSVRGATNLGAPFFSPDGQWLAYSDGQTLMKVPVTGGPAVEIGPTGPAAIGAWSPAGIVFTDVNGLYRISPDGGAAEPLASKLGPNEQAMFPQFLPGNEAVLFTVIPTRTLTPFDAANSPGARVDVLDLTTGTRRTVLHGGGRAQFAPTGHLVYVARDALHAVAFDPQRAEVHGEPVQVIAGVGSAEFALADDGTLIYQASRPLRDSTLVWVDRQGRQEPLEAPPQRYAYPRISPDGTRIALDVQGPSNRDIWIWHLGRKTLERFTVDPAGNPLVTWSRDGSKLAFGSDRYGVTNMFIQSADGSGEPERLLVSDRLQMPMTFAPDGRLLFSADVAGRGRDILGAVDGWEPPRGAHSRHRRQRSDRGSVAGRALDTVRLG